LSHSTREAVLTYLEVVRDPVPTWAIVRYMDRMHKVDAGAVRTCLYRLHTQGLIRRVQVGVYQRIDTGSDGGGKR
jgi:predicted transcriptional regulator of viral defense system